MVGGIHYRLDLKDTSGMDYYDSLRPLDYSGTDIFLVCFSVVSPTSFDDVKNKVNDIVFKCLEKFTSVLKSCIGHSRCSA